MKVLSGPTDHVVVVGAGLAGLSAALHLLGAGRRVTVVERDALPGGRAGRIERNGYRMDTGPTVLTMPDLVEEAFAAVGERLADRMELIALHPAYRARFADGSQLDVHTDAEAMEAEVERFAGPAAAAGYRRLRDWLEKLYRVQMRRFIDTNFDSPLQLLHPDLARLAALGGFGRLDARDRPLPPRRTAAPSLHLPGPVRRRAARTRPRRLRRHRLHGHGRRGVLPPRRDARPARGPWRTRPPTRAPTSATATHVTRLERTGDRITAVITDARAHPLRRGGPHPGPARQLRPARHGSPRRPLRAAPLAVRGGPARRHRPYLAATGPPHDLLRRRLAKRTFHELTRTGRLMSDPSLLITRPTATDPRLAPPGRHLHYILAPCPNTDIGPGAGEWRDLAPRYRDSLLAELERRGLDRLRRRHRGGVPGHPGRLDRAGARRRHARSPPRTPSRRPAPSARAIWCAARRTPCSRAAAPPRASACRPS